MFKNIAPTDFSLKQERANLQKALEDLTLSLKNPFIVKPIINGEKYDSKNIFERFDPNDNTTLIARVHLANQELAEKSLLQARSSQYNWKHTSIEKRSEILKASANLMDQKRHYLSSIIIKEAGKPWLEADRDVVEAIDFLNFYAEQNLLLKPFKTDDILGEDNFYFYESLGTSVVISPWNFPIAIPCGMLSASLVTGNTVIFKPAELTSSIALELVKIFFEAGLPKDVLSFLPGKGKEIGPILINSDITNLVCFTGSLEVGKQIQKSVGEIKNSQSHIKKGILELGGKNAIIIDDDADLDEAIRGVIYSSFGFSGQKCSACSRLIVLKDIYSSFIERFIPAVSDIIVGPSTNPETLLGPVIDKIAKERILDIIKDAKLKNKLLFQGDVVSNGNFVPITVFEVENHNDNLFQDEIFGPVLAIAVAKNLGEALKIANDSKYALTGGIFSRSPENINKVVKDFRVGNLYINRSCTGAVVGRQPFGGFNLSGIGSKAGGVDYLKQFVVPRTVSENTLRRGFTPDLN